MARSTDSSKDADWYACPFCGTEVRVGSRGCPKCTPGAGKSWQQDGHSDGVDLPDDAEDFDYDAFLKNEFGKGSGAIKPATLKWKWWITGVLLLAGMIAGLILHFV